MRMPSVPCRLACQPMSVMIEQKTNLDSHSTGEVGHTPHGPVGREYAIGDHALHATIRNIAFYLSVSMAYRSRRSCCCREINIVKTSTQDTTYMNVRV